MMGREIRPIEITEAATTPVVAASRAPTKITAKAKPPRIGPNNWPMALSLLAVLVVSNSGALLLGFSRGDVEVGLYTTAYKLMFISTVASGAMMSAYFPVLSQVGNDPQQA